MKMKLTSLRLSHNLYTTNLPSRIEITIIRYIEIRKVSFRKKRTMGERKKQKRRFKIVRTNLKNDSFLLNKRIFQKFLLHKIK